MRGAEAHLRADRRMARVVDEVGPYRLRRRRGLYRALVEAVIAQQLSGAAASSISARFRALYGPGFPSPAAVAATPERRLRGAGLSAAKARCLREASAAIASGSLPLRGLARRPDAEVAAALEGVRGIGRWTAEMFLIFALGRQDVLPSGDLGLRKGVRDLLGMGRLPGPAEAEAAAEAWRPHRTAATWYLWRWQGGAGGM